MSDATSVGGNRFPGPYLLDLRSAQPEAIDGTKFIGARSFVVAWTPKSAGDLLPLVVESGDEYLMLLPDVGADIAWSGNTESAPARSVCVIPSGATAISLMGRGRCIRLFSHPAPTFELHEPDVSCHGQPAPDLQLVKPAFQRISESKSPIVYPIDEFPNSPGMPRAKLFQSATLSINWVEYEGPRDRQSLSPHSHTDIEQGSLAIEGSFVHHFRTPWGKDASAWREDQHLECEADSLTIIPPPIIHTTEGVGDGRHILIDIFSPPRRDFIAKDQVLNSKHYFDPKSEVTKSTV